MNSVIMYGVSFCNELLEKSGLSPLFLHYMAKWRKYMALSKKQIIELEVNELLTKIVEETEYEIVDVEYVQERGEWFLRVFVDRLAGFGLEDCQWVSERLSLALEETECIGNAYTLEVSSPGIDRQLKKDSDFIRYAGRDVEVHLFAPVDGKKIFVGMLSGLVNECIVIENEDKEIVFEKQKVALVKLYVEF